MIINAGRGLFAATWKWCGSSFSVILVLLWDYLMYLQAIFLKYFIVQELYSEYKGNTNDDGIALSVVYYVFFLSFPLFCLIADVWVGRHKTIMIGVSLCFLSWIIGGLEYLINSLYALPQISILLIYGASILINYAGYGIFKATIVQYNIDQLVGASASLLDAVIYCHSAVVPVGYIRYYCCFDVPQSINFSLYYRFLFLGYLVLLCWSLIHYSNTNWRTYH